MKGLLQAALLVLLAGCGGGDGGDAGPGDAGPWVARIGVPGPGGVIGVCCLPDPHPDCDCSPEGGWSRDPFECALGFCDAPSWCYMPDVDEWGCPYNRFLGYSCIGGSCL